MKFPLLGECLVAGGVGLLAVSALMAQRPAAPLRSEAALVDIGKVSQGYSRLTQNLEALKKDYEAKAEVLKKESEAGNQLTEKARALPPASPERKKLEGDLLKMRADFDLHGKRLTEDIRDRQTKIYFTALTEIKDEIARYAETNGIKLVLRYDPTPPDLSDREVILQEIQKPIVYQRESEITPAIADAVNRRSNVPATGRKPANPTR